MSLFVREKFKIVVIDSFINSNPKSLVLKICELNRLNVKENLKIITGDLNNKNLIDHIFFTEKKLMSQLRE